MSISGCWWGGAGAALQQAEQGQEDVALRQSPIHHWVNLPGHLQVPGTVLSPAGLQTPQALFPRSLRVGQEDGFQADGCSLLLMGRQGEERRREGGLPRGCREEWHTWSLSGILYPRLPLRPASPLKSSNFGPQLPPACHVPTQSFSETRSCG